MTRSPKSVWIGWVLVACLLPFGTSCDEKKPVRIKKNEKYWGPFPPQEESQKAGGDNVDIDQGFGPTGGKIDLANAGTIRGVIKFKGEAPKRREIQMDKAPWCVQNAPKLFTEDAVVDAQGNVGNCVAFIEFGMNKQSMPVPTTPAKLEQKGCRYIPHVLTLRVGQELQVINDDTTSHNYKLTAQANESINKTQSKPSTNSEYLTKPELRATFNCDVHPWMLSHVRIFTHDYFVTTAEDGKFEIKNVPPGKYKIGFVHERWKAASVEVTVNGKDGADVGEIVLN